MTKKILTKVALLSAISFGFTANAQQKAVFSPKENKIPQKNDQVAGFYRMKVGDYEITALYDGYLTIGTGAYQPFTKLSKQQLDELISGKFRPLLFDGGVNTAVSAYLVNTGKNLVLIDAGSGDKYGASVDRLGKLPENLKKAGYKPEQIDIILPTHLHFDHFSGVTVGGKAIFPNATIYIANEEKAFWYDTKIEDMPEHTRKYAQWTRDAVAPYAKKNRVKYYNLGEEVIPNFKSVATIGHTPGHGGFEISSKGETIFMWGDLLHNHALQLPEPEIAAEFDVYPTNARDSRVAKLPELAQRKIWVAGAHLPFPGIGHIAKEKEGFSWVPIEYVPLEY